MITKTFEKDYDSMAYTLNTKEVDGPVIDGLPTLTHPDGWTISGKIHDDYYEWVNEFKAVHDTYGIVEGNFDEEVTATSQEGYDHFFLHHTPEEWDYWDI